MIYEMYSIYDRKEKAYTSPFVAPNRDVCIRMVKGQVDKISFRSDKFLVYLGTFDDELGIIEAPSGCSGDPRFPGWHVSLKSDTFDSEQEIVYDTDLEKIAEEYQNA